MSKIDKVLDMVFSMSRDVKEARITRARPEGSAPMVDISAVVGKERVVHWVRMEAELLDHPKVLKDTLDHLAIQIEQGHQAPST